MKIALLYSGNPFVVATTVKAQDSFKYHRQFSLGCYWICDVVLGLEGSFFIAEYQLGLKGKIDACEA